MPVGARPPILNDNPPHCRLSGRTRMGALQPGHLLLILVIVLVVFGPGKLPELGRALGDGIRELKRATDGEAHSSASATASDGAPLHAGTAATVQSAAPRACPSCNATVGAANKFCGSCGQPIPSPTGTPS